MRYFIGISLPQEVKDYLVDLQKNIGNDSAKVRWVSKKNLHLTLKFLGDLDENTLQRTRAILRSISFSSFSVTLGKIGLFPSIHRPRILWINLLPPKNILELQGDIEYTLSSLFPRDKQFTVHLTLGRIVFLKHINLLTKLDSLPLNCPSFTLSSFSLFQSVLHHHGPTYTLIETYQLH